MTLYRALNKNGRIAYHPEWSESQPYHVYKNGCAGLHFSTLFDVFAYMIKNGFEF